MFRNFKTISLGLASLLALAAQVPRPSPDYTLEFTGRPPIHISQYRGKVVNLLFILTTCTHCQHTTQLLSGMQNEYGKRGFQVLAGAINPNPDVPQFIEKFKPAFPLTATSHDLARGFMQIGPTVRTTVPLSVWIDRQGVIREQFEGSSDFFKDEEKNTRALIEKLLAEPAQKAKKP